MAPQFLRNFLVSAAALVVAGLAPQAFATPSHGIAMYGEPALPPDFVALPQVNPDAPKGGRITFGEPGAFDSLNPHILKGSAPYGVGVHVFESLMGRAYNEPFTLYCTLCESVETDSERTWVEFTLRPEAKFSDGSPVTVEDVRWSFETLGTKGHPRYLNTWSKIGKIEVTGERSIRFEFNVVDRELPLIIALRPVLKKSVWDGKDFSQSGFATTPIGSGPYVIGDYEPGRYIRLMKDPDWWGNDLPFYRGQHNFDEIRYDYFGDGDIIFEAFKAGELSSWRELNAARWESQHDFPRVRSGDVVKSLIPHERPSGMIGYVMNTRNPLFQDWRVREALITAFNYEFIAETLNAAGDPRITSYFSNSLLGMEHGPATGRELELLEPFRADLPEGTIEGYSLPVGDGSERNRRNISRSVKLMEEAGYTVQDGVMKDANGTPFRFEILLAAGATENLQTMQMYAQGLERMGITPVLTVVDSAQYKQRTDAFEFDMAYMVRALSLSPGNEQMLYWGSEGVDQPGSRNWMGMNSPAAEAMIATMLSAKDQSDFIAATKALDRVLTAGRYVIPVWFTPVARIAHDKRLKFPADRLPIYGDWLGFQPEIWWYEE